ncbi:TetR/AcrR family transcriptional regulator [Devosia sp. A16]|uniref:TetR/AcrR family transcriptional regulator n=1 Tax=Devosia sp. A16 TaxID=1736675 RepID=UPI0006D7D07F|nr:TetR/AcrR family transcriptional regulator [Devosia sp. A16]
MKVSREQATKNRAHVVETAGAEFRKHGFDGIGVADLMRAAGLTHGGFYNSFASKDALAAEAVGRVFAETTERLRRHALAAADPYAAMVRFYLSPQHRDAVESGCAIAALSQEAARGSSELRTAFEAGIAAYLELIVELGGVSRSEAMGIYATMVGALSLARTVLDPALSTAILVAAADNLLARKNPQAAPLRS